MTDYSDYYSYADIVRVLERARAKIANPDNWTRVFVARNALGSKCPAKSEEACSWCALGAVVAVAKTCEASAAALDLLEVASGADERFKGDIGLWNDDPETSHSDVLAAFDAARLEAIEEAKRNGWKLGWKV